VSRTCPKTLDLLFLSRSRGKREWLSVIVLDPHMGGGTTLVEARASGREALGVDISALAEFVARVKCTVYSERELDLLGRWAENVVNAVDIQRPSVRCMILKLWQS